MTKKTKNRPELEEPWKSANVRFDWTQGLPADRGLVERFFSELTVDVLRKMGEQND